MGVSCATLSAINGAPWPGRPQDLAQKDQLRRLLQRPAAQPGEAAPAGAAAGGAEADAHASATAAGETAAPELLSLAGKVRGRAARNEGRFKAHARPIQSPATDCKAGERASDASKALVATAGAARAPACFSWPPRAALVPSQHSALTPAPPARTPPPRPVPTHRRCCHQSSCETSSSP
jgi:hypothetical protein